VNVPRGGVRLRVWPSETMYGGEIHQDSGGTPISWQYFSDPAHYMQNITLSPTFSTYGWRWLAVQLSLMDNSTHQPDPITPTIGSARGLFVRASAPTVGTWTSSNMWVNRIHNITLEAIAANLQSVLTDCPHRERLGWLEVSHLMFPSIAYNYDIPRLWAKISLDTVDSQLASCMVPDIAPEYTVFSGGFRDSPEWGSGMCPQPCMAAGLVRRHRNPQFHIHHGEALR